MSDAKLTFDADTSAYDAKTQASLRHTTNLVDAFKDAAGPLLKIASVAGAIELAIDGVKSKWEQWRHMIEEAEQTSKKLGTTLAATVGSMGLIASYPEIKKAVQETGGPLDVEQRRQVLGSFAGTRPQPTVGEAKLILSQAQKASYVVGQEGVGAYAEAVGLGMQSGLSQQSAGDAAIAAVQSGAHGLEAYTRAAGKFAEEHPDLKERQKSDFLGYIRNAGSDVFGTRPGQIMGGQALQRRLAGNVAGLLDQQSGVAANVDPTLKTQRDVQTLKSGTEVLNEEKHGSRAELEAEYDALIDERRKRGQFLLPGRTFSTEKEIREKIEAMKASNEARGRAFLPLGQNQGVRPDQARETYIATTLNREGLYAGAEYEKRRTEILDELKRIREHTSKSQGAERFRNEAQDRDKGEE